MKDKEIILRLFDLLDHLIDGIVNIIIIKEKSKIKD